MNAYLQRYSKIEKSQSITTFDLFCPSSLTLLAKSAILELKGVKRKYHIVYDVQEGDIYFGDRVPLSEATSLDKVCSLNEAASSSEVSVVKYVLIT